MPDHNYTGKINPNRELAAKPVTFHYHEQESKGALALAIINVNPAAVDVQGNAADAPAAAPPKRAFIWPSPLPVHDFPESERAAIANRRGDIIYDALNFVASLGVLIYLWARFSDLGALVIMPSVTLIMCSLNLLDTIVADTTACRYLREFPLVQAPAARARVYDGLLQDSASDVAKDLTVFITAVLTLVAQYYLWMNPPLGTPNHTAWVAFEAAIIPLCVSFVVFSLSVVQYCLVQYRFARPWNTAKPGSLNVVRASLNVVSVDAGKGQYTLQACETGAIVELSTSKFSDYALKLPSDMSPGLRFTAIVSRETSQDAPKLSSLNVQSAAMIDGVALERAASDGSSVTFRDLPCGAQVEFTSTNGKTWIVRAF